MLGTELLDNCEYSNNRRAPAYQKNSKNKYRRNSDHEPAIQSENKSVGLRFQPFLAGQGKHHFRTPFANQVGNRYEFISARPQLIDDLRQRRHGLASVAATVVKQNNISVVRLPQNAINNLLRRNLLPVRLPPVVRIDLLTDDQIPHVLRHGQQRYLLRILRLMVNSVWWTEQNRFHSQRAPNQPLRKIQFPAKLRRRNLIERRMRVCMIPDLMSFRIFAPQNLRPLARI